MDEGQAGLDSAVHDNLLAIQKNPKEDTMDNVTLIRVVAGILAVSFW